MKRITYKLFSETLGILVDSILAHSEVALSILPVIAYITSPKTIIHTKEKTHMKSGTQI